MLPENMIAADHRDLGPARSRRNPGKKKIFQTESMQLDFHHQPPCQPCGKIVVRNRFATLR